MVAILPIEMESGRVCRTCSLSVNANDTFFIICKGSCGGKFHCNCVGLRDIHWNVIRVLSKNVVWMCDSCMDEFQRAKNHVASDSSTSNSPTIVEEVIELKNTVADIMKTISTIRQSVPTGSQIDARLLHSTPDSFKLLDGSGSEGSANDTESQCREDVNNDSNGFSLFLTNIDTSATERDVQWMVARAIGDLDPERIDVIKLVSKMKSHLRLDFVSFKVVVPSKFKSCAMNPTTWPKNVKFREFIRSNKCTCTWKPYT